MLKVRVALIAAVAEGYVVKLYGAVIYIKLRVRFVVVYGGLLVQHLGNP